MKFTSAQDFLSWPHKTLLLAGMSGVGKTRLAKRLGALGSLHYSVDYQIADRYLRAPIEEWIAAQAQKIPLFQALLEKEALGLSMHVSPSQFFALSCYLGKPGNPQQGGLAFEEYQKRQAQHLQAERAALFDFWSAARAHAARPEGGLCVCDTSGSLCEIIGLDHEQKDLPLAYLLNNTLLVYIEHDTSHHSELLERFKRKPKPIYYRPDFLTTQWQTYKTLHAIDRDCDVEPDAFSIWAFERLLEHRLPRYQALAERYGYTLSKEAVKHATSPYDLMTLICEAIENAH